MTDAALNAAAEAASISHAQAVLAVWAYLDALDPAEVHAHTEGLTHVNEVAEIIKAVRP